MYRRSEGNNPSPQDSPNTFLTKNAQILFSAQNHAREFPAAIWGSTGVPPPQEDCPFPRQIPGYVYERMLGWRVSVPHSTRVCGDVDELTAVYLELTAVSDSLDGLLAGHRCMRSTRLDSVQTAKRRAAPRVPGVPTPDHGDTSVSIHSSSSLPQQLVRLPVVSASRP